ncbi:MAG TPA: 16S rRNA (guanine(527)-N(7))-methyltransferase RsmG [bacterium]|nr:16S rRNA (guanine(527)-N(7))-methyltransferase RsmG [bacterium]
MDFSTAYLRHAAATGLPPDRREILAVWYALLVKWNRRINLTRVDAPEDVVAYHLADCVPLARSLADGERLLDIGSGAGVPGLVVAALREDVTVVCAESTAKKAAFLSQATLAMKLPNVRIHHGRAEQMTERFDTITARAVAKPGELAQRFGHLLVEGGKLAVFAAEKTDAAPPLGWRQLNEISYDLPAGHGARTLFIFVTAKK